MLGKCKKPLDELTFQVWCYCVTNHILNIALHMKVGQNYRWTERQTDRHIGNSITRCPEPTFQARGIKNYWKELTFSKRSPGMRSRSLTSGCHLWSYTGLTSWELSPVKRSRSLTSGCHLWSYTELTSWELSPVKRSRSLTSECHWWSYTGSPQSWPLILVHHGESWSTGPSEWNHYREL